MNEKQGAFRFTYFTNKYEETCSFYQDKLGFSLEHAWDRDDQDKGALFKAGAGLIEVLLYPSEGGHKNKGLDYRSPQGVFICLQVWDVDGLFDTYKAREIPFKQEITDQSWGHRSFSILEPNGLVLFFFEEQF